MGVLLLNRGDEIVSKQQHNPKFKKTKLSLKNKVSLNTKKQSNLSFSAISYDDFADAVRSRLVTCRSDMGLSLGQASVLSGFSRNGLEKIECGDVQPTLESLLKLAIFYKESLPEFLDNAMHSLGLASQYRVKIRSEIVKKQEREKLLLELLSEFELLHFLDDIKRLKELNKENPEAAAGIKQLLHALVPRIKGK